LCNQVYKLSYSNLPEVTLLIHDGDTKKKLKVEFVNVQVSIPEKYESAYK
jgi:hypothetical protein